MTFPAYPEYKDSGVDWFGNVPLHWSITSLKWLANLQSGEGITSEAIEETGDYPVYGGNGVRGYTTAFTHEGSFPLIGRQGALCGNINYADGRFWASEHAVVAKPVEGVVVRWLGELLRAMELGQYSLSAAQPGLSVDVIKRLSVPFPPMNEQRAIAAFLDRETGKIDALVAEQEKLIDLLKEKRQAVISHAVTKGLDSNVSMKDSGVEWLGEIPAHWTMERLKHLSPQITVGIVVNPSNYVADEGLPFLYGGDITEGKINVAGARCISREDSKRNAKTQLQQGDIVTVRVGAPGVSAVVPAECEGGNCASVMLTRKGDFVSDWLCLAMNSRMVRYQVEVVQYGAAQEQFNISHAVDFWVATPPKAEQAAIAERLKTEMAKFDGLITEAQGAIDLLKERRSALISAAVTGKIDVREVADVAPPNSKALEPL